MVTVLQQVYFQNKKQQAFLSLIVLNIFQQCILPGINAKSSYDHLIKSQYTKEISSLVLLVSQQKKLFCEDAQRSQIICFSLCLTALAKYHNLRKGLPFVKVKRKCVCIYINKSN